MSENLKEGRPLLCDEYSDEESQLNTSNPKFRRFRHSPNFGRARTHTIGAAAIINRWPDHLSSLLTYWWMAVVMIILIIFVIYNSIITFATLPTTHPRPYLNFKKYENNVRKTAYKKYKTDIYLHIFVTDYDDLNLNNYLKHINIISNQHSHFMYNVMVILKDDFNESFNDHINNEMALNSLMVCGKRKDNIKLNENTNVEILSLSKLMDDSPLKKYWRHLPSQFLGFLARCIAIWEKGGIAFDPIILTENSPNSAYIDKLENILFKFKSQIHNTKEKYDSSPRKKVNNIRDVIENLEDLSQNNNENSLSEAENNIMEIINFNEKKNQTNDTESSTNDFTTLNYKNNLSSFSEDNKPNKSINEIDDKVTSRNLLPMFLEYLFHRPTTIESKSYIENRNTTDGSKEQNHFIENITFNKRTFIGNNENNTLQNYTRKFKNTKHDKQRSHKKEKSTSKNNNKINLTIDLKGLVIATKTPCHAFIGSIFSNVFKHSDEETVTDLIIEELSIFCKGILSLCKGVNVILL